jgi:hypothetical protein
MHGSAAYNQETFDFFMCRLYFREMVPEDVEPSREYASLEDAERVLRSLAEKEGIELRGDETPAEILDLLDTPSLPRDAHEALGEALRRLQGLDDAVK